MIRAICIFGIVYVSEDGVRVGWDVVEVRGNDLCGQCVENGFESIDFLDTFGIPLLNLRSNTRPFVFESVGNGLGKLRKAMRDGRGGGVVRTFS
jgi:hypothetical protein